MSEPQQDDGEEDHTGQQQPRNKIGFDPMETCGPQVSEIVVDYSDLFRETIEMEPSATIVRRPARKLSFLQDELFQKLNQLNVVSEPRKIGISLGASSGKRDNPYYNPLIRRAVVHPGLSNQVSTSIIAKQPGNAAANLQEAHFLLTQCLLSKSELSKQMSLGPQIDFQSDRGQRGMALEFPNVQNLFQRIKKYLQELIKNANMADMRSEFDHDFVLGEIKFWALMNILFGDPSYDLTSYASWIDDPIKFDRWLAAVELRKGKKDEEPAWKKEVHRFKQLQSWVALAATGPILAVRSFCLLSHVFRRAKILQ